ncbi:flagellar assembly protein T N-terminal domain-containing protein [Paraneptunicella aestuarii]|uniref:flagellar assembly protein T N-terminal domain-containing protein n=1 Tax=Paraneptunicella aestuarii TaxID=2831148 RepID=UPI001E2BDEA5|nr:flagellar assembly protein T N-terminal domain-containing protein [Paraneptunicella aestuarii]UAA39466.1 flagellar assembly protein T N-terminal domain-containing protein [Paraneptunicella aestuarii]
MNKLIKFWLLLSLSSLSFSSSAIWFEATGQAAIHNNNKEMARQRATQEAIQQALLFSGASVRSVQTMAHGLLKDDRFEVRASGEVSSIELVNELIEDDYVTVTIRADIFPQDTQCKSSDYKKSVITTWFPLENRQQAAFGNIFDIGQPIAGLLKEEFDMYSRYAGITKVESFYFSPHEQQVQHRAMDIARKNGGQFVLLGSVKNLSIEEAEESYSDYLTFWNSKSPTRNIAFHMKLIDGSTGELLMDKIFRNRVEWTFDRFESVDVRSGKLWDSAFGNGVKQILQDIAQEVDETVSCIPAYGRIIEVRNNQVAANIGSSQGVKQGDELKIFQMRQFFTPTGEPHYQYDIHPVTMVVAKVYHNSSVLRPNNGMPLANIQPNDFVVRQ